MPRDTTKLARKLQNLQEGDTRILKFNDQAMSAQVEKIEERRETRDEYHYYRNGISITRKVIFDTPRGKAYARCFWWPNYHDRGLQMDGGLQLPESSPTARSGYSFSIHKSLAEIQI